MQNPMTLFFVIITSF